MRKTQLVLPIPHLQVQACRHRPQSLARGALGDIVDLEAAELQETRELLRELMGVLDGPEVGLHRQPQCSPTGSMREQRLDDDRGGHRS